jgi:seryl-tRNA synthetase
VTTPDAATFARMDEKYARDDLKQDLTKVLEGLERARRDVMREIDRISEVGEAQDHPTSAIDIARRTQHTILWMVPNLNLDKLPEAAQRLDNAVAARISTEENKAPLAVRLADALRVLTLDPLTRMYLEDNDPKALDQAQSAVNQYEELGGK